MFYDQIGDFEVCGKASDIDESNGQWCDVTVTWKKNGAHQSLSIIEARSIELDNGSEELLPSQRIAKDFPAEKGIVDIVLRSVEIGSEVAMNEKLVEEAAQEVLGIWFTEKVQPLLQRICR